MTIYALDIFKLSCAAVVLSSIEDIHEASAMIWTGTPMRLGVLASVLFGVLVATTGIAREARGEDKGFPPVRDFVDFLAARDLVVQATVVEAKPMHRTMLGTCGMPKLGPYAGLELTLHIERVWQGVAQDTIVQMSVLGNSILGYGRVQRGTRVLAWGVRECDDGWRLWGQFCTVAVDGRLMDPRGDESYLRIEGLVDRQRLRLASVDSAYAARSGARLGLDVYSGAAYVAVARLARILSRGESGYSVEVDSLGWVFGRGTYVPRQLDFAAIRDCSGFVGVGDTLIVPVSGTEPRTRVAFATCAGNLEVRRGFVVRLGVPLDSIGSALRRDKDGIRVRAFRAKD